MRRSILGMTVLLVQTAGGSLSAQSAETRRAGERAPIPLEVEIALARSAAPPEISAAATVLAFREGRYVEVVPGTNGVTCFVNRDWMDSLEPHCHGPAEGRGPVEAATRLLEGRHKGLSETVLRQRAMESSFAGDSPIPTRPAFSYMFSAGQRLWGDSASFAGRWMPHVMIAIPYITNADLGLPGTPDMSVGTVFEEGTVDATLVVPVPGFMDPEEPAAAWLAARGDGVPPEPPPTGTHAGGTSDWVARSVVKGTGDAAYRELSIVDEVSLARSAAPESVSGAAAVWVLRDGRYRLEVPGDNGVQCMVARSIPLALEPICYDAEAARTLMAVELLRFDLRQQGRSLQEARDAVEGAVGSGRIPTPTRPALAYMMSAEQHLYASADQPVGRWKPHLMLLIPGLTSREMGLTDEHPWLSVTEPASPTAQAIIVVPGAVSPRGSSPSLDSASP